VIKVAFPSFHRVSKKFRHNTIKHGLTKLPHAIRLEVYSGGFQFASLLEYRPFCQVSVVILGPSRTPLCYIKPSHGRFLPHPFQIYTYIFSVV